jgi:hypothetical protein
MAILAYGLQSDENGRNQPATGNVAAGFCAKTTSSLAYRNEAEISG